ncbi:hypothetical protein FIBSPDRAFT_385139 [Athelia psychrophila]|uniref:Uncharacterized protein n=1 Tax=Athelia psychrophila TaxID=1759441 RepID=A0A167V8Q5_9AGAM|nr:hypothetical protein FIBSPDRAFT_385139 [Fibularhizoctonia sp. CBS 109695]
MLPGASSHQRPLRILLTHHRQHPVKHPAPRCSQNVWGYVISVFMITRAPHHHKCVCARPLLGQDATTPSRPPTTPPHHYPTPRRSLTTMEKALDARAPPLVYPEYKHVMCAGSCLTAPASPPLNPHPAIAPSSPAVSQYIQGTTTVDFTIPASRHNKEREHNHVFFRSRPPSIAARIRARRRHPHSY